MKLNNKSLILLCGPIGAGKSTFAKKYFDIPIISPDYYRFLVSGDEGNQAASKSAFEIAFKVAEERMKFSQPVVIDALNKSQSSRNQFYKLADKYAYDKIVVVFNVPLTTCILQNTQRERQVDFAVVEVKHKEFLNGLSSLKTENIHDIIQHDKVNEKFTFEIKEEILNNRFDDIKKVIIFGDIHSCFNELKDLIEKVKQAGYDPFTNHEVKFAFVGDLLDRGDTPVETIDYIFNLVNSGLAFVSMGNHDNKLMRYLNGSKVKLTHGLEETVYALKGPKSSDKLRNKVIKTLENLPYHIIFDNGKLIVCHAGIKDEMIGKSNGYVNNFSIYGEVTGEKDEHGYPVRKDWASNRVITDSSPVIVYGHTPLKEVYSINKCHNIDTGCSFGGKLTALIYDDSKISFISVPARKVYCEHRGELTYYGEVERFTN